LNSLLKRAFVFKKETKPLVNGPGESKAH